MMSDVVRSRNTAALLNRFAAVFTLREVFLMMHEVVRRSHALLCVAIDPTCLDAGSARKGSYANRVFRHHMGRTNHLAYVYIPGDVNKAYLVMWDLELKLDNTDRKWVDRALARAKKAA